MNSPIRASLIPCVGFLLRLVLALALVLACQAQQFHGGGIAHTPQTDAVVGQPVQFDLGWDVWDDWGDTHLCTNATVTLDLGGGYLWQSGNLITNGQTVTVWHLFPVPTWSVVIVTNGSVSMPGWGAGFRVRAISPPLLPAALDAPNALLESVGAIDVIDTRDAAGGVPMAVRNAYPGQTRVHLPRLSIERLDGGGLVRVAFAASEGVPVVLETCTDLGASWMVAEQFPALSAGEPIARVYPIDPGEPTRLFRLRRP